MTGKTNEEKEANDASKKKKFFKILLLGDPLVGKTSLRNRYFGKGFKTSYLVTMGADFGIKRIDNNVLQIWDLAGNQGYSNIRKNYYLGSHGAMLVFEVTRRVSFTNLQLWVRELISNNNGKMIPLILTGNKIDLLDEKKREVSVEEVLEYQQSLQKTYGFSFPYIETSAKSGQNVDNIFEQLILEILK
ncbi:MAG: GTP-binding protein [Candidatus Heimdallarchaeota archaeon]|nr:GTP-binding protein [Candidatus Heimdallarchaeota archaeon]